MTEKSSASKLFCTREESVSTSVVKTLFSRMKTQRDLCERKISRRRRGLYNLLSATLVRHCLPSDGMGGQGRNRDLGVEEKTIRAEAEPKGGRRVTDNPDVGSEEREAQKEQE